MANLESPGKRLIWVAGELGVLFLFWIAVPACCRAQAAAEAAGAAASSAGVAASATKAFRPALPGPPPAAGSVGLPVRTGPPADEVNRKTLQQRAGKDAAKLLLQSVPTAAAVYVDGKIVGRSPLLLIVPAGEYKVEMRGQREEFGERVVSVSANETQKLMLPLVLRYPAKVTVFSAHANAAGSVASAATSPGPAVRQDPGIDEVNRKALEQRAGRDAAKLVLESVPSDAMAYLDGAFVGRTPVTLVVAPGKYEVEMRGQRDELGERLIGILPNETQQLLLPLARRYPARITVR